MKRIMTAAILAVSVFFPAVSGAAPIAEKVTLEVAADPTPSPSPAAAGPLVLVRDEAPPKVEEGPNDTGARVVSGAMLPVVAATALASLTLAPLAAVDLAGGADDGCPKDAECAGFTPAHSATLVGGLGMASSLALIVSAAELEDREVAHMLTITGSVGLTLSAASLGLGIAALVRQSNREGSDGGTTVQLPLVSGSF